jgi:hypothetical protein
LEKDEFEVDQQELVLVVVFYITENKRHSSKDNQTLTIEHDHELLRLQEKNKREI